MLDTQAPDSVRLDQWLWAARFFRTRALARQAVDTGKVELAGQRPKAARAIRAGEALRIQRGEEVFEVLVRGVSDVRGPAPVAQALYEETVESKARRKQQRLQRAAMRDGY